MNLQAKAGRIYYVPGKNGAGEKGPLSRLSLTTFKISDNQVYFESG